MSSKFKFEISWWATRYSLSTVGYGGYTLLGTLWAYVLELPSLIPSLYIFQCFTQLQGYYPHTHTTPSYPLYCNSGPTGVEESACENIGSYYNWWNGYEGCEGREFWAVAPDLLWISVFETQRINMKYRYSSISLTGNDTRHGNPPSDRLTVTRGWVPLGTTWKDWFNGRSGLVLFTDTA